MRILLYIFIFCSALYKAQDKLFFNDGSVKNGTLVSMGRDLIYFKSSDTAIASRVKKSELMMLEDYKGTRYIFGAEAGSPPENKEKSKVLRRNYFGIQPLALFMGRATFVYERLNEEGSIGLAFPLSLTFNPGYDITKVDTFNVVHKYNVNVMGGIELNFYFRAKEHSKFFIGPRFRYGTDVFLNDTEGYSFQTQCGLKFENPDTRFVQHISLGFGLLKVISTKGSSDLNRPIACYSFNYRLSLKW